MGPCVCPYSWETSNPAPTTLDTHSPDFEVMAVIVTFALL